MIKKQRGGSIIEIMVGLFVGLLVTLTAYETFVFMEVNKRITVSDNNAFANLITGMQAIDHDIKMAGLGLSAPSISTCTVLNAYFNAAPLSDGNTIGPVMIQSGGGAPDSLTTFHGNSVTGGAPASILTAMGSSTAPIAVTTSAGLQIGQQALLMEPSDTIPCTIIGVTDVQDMGNFLNISHASGAGGSLYNPPNPDTAYSNSVLYTENAVILNLDTVQWQTWRVNNGQLEIVDAISGVTNPMVDSIVHMRAQYGVTDGVSDSISQWVDATGAWAVLDRTEIMRIRAIRVALVARNPKREKPTVSGGPCDATTTAPRPWPAGAPVDLSNDPNWQCHRYDVMKTVMPLKNMVWSANV